MTSADDQNRNNPFWAKIPREFLIQSWPSLLSGYQPTHLLRAVRRGGFRGGLECSGNGFKGRLEVVVLSKEVWKVFVAVSKVVCNGLVTGLLADGEEAPGLEAREVEAVQAAAAESLQVPKLRPAYLLPIPRGTYGEPGGTLAPTRGTYGELGGTQESTPDT
eukprot:2311031-Rhodomonas_salina.1